MKWYKHLAGSLNNSIIAESIERFGGDGYLVFFGILELISDEFDIYHPGEKTLRMSKVRQNLQLSRQKIVKILSFFDQKAKINTKKNVSFFATVEGDAIHIKCNRLAELCDNHTQKLLKDALKLLQSEIEVTSPHRSKKKEEEEEERITTTTPPIPPRKNNPPPYKKIIEYLNEKTGKNFQVNSKETKSLIKARWNSGFILADFKKVIDNKTAKWLTDPKMIDYLRPQTLFGTKFESYLQEKVSPLKGVVSEKGMRTIENLSSWMEDTA